ncbi:hypothetical protein LPTSP2_39420 [Leptospira ellinghausenii]|uniref:Uncharacterized protein n=1 Tax=Leptospira ellinghausenii TaxID=1917822 RepID=A0A2P2DJ62_9LEPT|nr:hypothetical protein [Leptospira ellinghausenii]GBF44639.1 hypothetical protein LPTSP2_39420 [Leptospira ellinghausenii]
MNHLLLIFYPIRLALKASDKKLVKFIIIFFIFEYMKILKKIFFLLVLLFIPSQIILLPVIQNFDSCSQFHKGIFQYEYENQIIKVLRTSNKSFAYRKYPDSYSIDSIEWISPCIAKLVCIKDNEDTDNEDTDNEDTDDEDYQIGTVTYLKITRTYFNKYNFILYDSKKDILIEGTVKRIKTLKD